MEAGTAGRAVLKEEANPLGVIGLCLGIVNLAANTLAHESGRLQDARGAADLADEG